MRAIEPAPPLRTEPPRFAPGALVGNRYRVRRFLAQGGMGQVYEVDDLELGDRVALKALRSELTSDEVALARFRREIQLARKVSHPNVCRLYEFGHHLDGGRRLPFLTMELHAGQTLAERLRRSGPLTVAEALPLARQMAAALDAAHAAGVIHRDFKSDNVVLAPALDGLRPVVTDFGLSRSTEAVQTSGVHGLVGTPAYMAPEQVTHGELTSACDVYAFGVVLFEMVTGELPFGKGSALEQALARVRHAPRRPRSIKPELPTEWESTILRALSRDPRGRFPSAGEAVAALTPKPRRRPLVWAAFGLALLGGCATAVGIASRPERASTPVVGSVKR